MLDAGVRAYNQALVADLFAVYAGDGRAAGALEADEVAALLPILQEAQDADRIILTASGIEAQHQTPGYYLSTQAADDLWDRIDDDSNDGSDDFWWSYPKHEINGRRVEGYSAHNLAAYLAGNDDEDSRHNVTEAHDSIAQYLVDTFAGSDGIIEDGPELRSLNAFLSTVRRGDTGFYLPT